MKPVTIVGKLPTAEEFNRLRSQVDWRTYHVDVIEKALPNSLYWVCTYPEGALVGMARIVGDGGMVYYIQDVIVLPEYQRQGIGTQMMDAIMAYIRSHASQYSNIGLMSAKGIEAFYERYGLTTRPTDKLGAGMTMIWMQK